MCFRHVSHSEIYPYTQPQVQYFRAGLNLFVSSAPQLSHRTINYGEPTTKSVSCKTWEMFFNSLSEVQLLNVDKIGGKR